MGQLEVGVLGAPRVRHGDAVLTFPTRKALALLLFLVVEGEPQPRDKLAALFWPERDQQHARAMLRYTLAALRRTLPDSAESPHIVADQQLLRVHPASQVVLDLSVLRAARTLIRTGTLEQLREAAECCRGEFLESFSLPDAVAFDEWASQQRDSALRDLELVVDRLSQMEIDRGDNHEAIRTLQRWLAISPLNEEAHRRLMRLHFAAGERSAALSAYESCRALLQRELGVAPAPETESLAQRIRTDGPVSRPSASDLLDTRSPPGAFEGPLIGRAREFATLSQLYQLARGGHVQVVVVRGEPGIGKTRLAREFVDSVAVQGAETLQGRAFEAGGRLPYQPLVDALRARLERENAPEDLLTDVWLIELSRLLPELHDRYPDLPSPAGDEAVARMRLFEAIARLGMQLAQRAPLVLFIDDIHCGDAGSLDALNYAARRWTESQTPVLVLVSVRPEEVAVSPGLTEWLVGLKRSVSVTQLDLGSLTAADTLHLVECLAVGAEQHEIDAFAGWLHDETGGHPLFILETLRSLFERDAVTPRRRVAGGWAFELHGDLAGEAGIASALAPGVREVILSRLARLTPASRELVAAGSVLGQGFTFQQLRRVGGLNEHDALLAMDEVLSAQLLLEAGTGDGGSPGAYVFAHDKVREAVYGAAGDARRRVFHRRALEILEGTAPAAQLAHHALAAGVDAAAIHWFRAAGDEAVQLLAAREAVIHYAQSLEIAARLGWRQALPDLHARRGRALASLARWVEARHDMEAALEALDTNDLEKRGELLVDLLEVCWWWLDVPTLRQRATEVGDMAEDLGRIDLQIAAKSWLLPTLSADGDVSGCLAEGERTFEQVRALDCAPPPAVEVYMAFPYYWLGRTAESVERIQEAADAARAAQHTSATMFALPSLGLMLAANGRYQEAQSAFDEALRFGREYGIGTLMARAISMSAGYHLDVGDFAGNEALSEEARELARSLSFLPPAISAGLDLMLNFARQREVARAEALIDEVADLADAATAWHGWLWKIRLSEARAEIALARRDWAAALQWSQTAIEHSRNRRVKYQVIGYGTHAAALHGLGRTREAIADLRRAVGLARHVEEPALFLRAARGLQELDGDDDLAAEVASVTTGIVQALPDARTREAVVHGHWWLCT
jgi:DNA-binding SARP family transcriptional activator